MKQLTVETSDIYKNLDGKFQFEINWSDNPYMQVFTSDNRYDAVKTYSLIESRINAYVKNRYLGVQTSDIDGFDYIKK